MAGTADGAKVKKKNKKARLTEITCLDKRQEGMLDGKEKGKGLTILK